MATEIGVSSHTISEWLSVLESSYIIFRLQPYFRNTTKRLLKSPKVYFCDTGLACHLLDIESEKELESHAMRGALFENLIVNEALKYRFNRAKTNNLCFYRDSNQNEIDLVMEEKNGLKGIEIKSSMTYHSSFEKPLRKMTSLVGENVSKKAVVYDGDYENTSGEIKVLNYRHMTALLSEGSGNEQKNCLNPPCFTEAIPFGEIGHKLMGMEIQTAYLTAAISVLNPEQLDFATNGYHIACGNGHHNHHCHHYRGYDRSAFSAQSTEHHHIRGSGCKH